MILAAVPREALLLGFSGVIPFAYGTYAKYNKDSQPEFSQRILKNYSASILSFMGAVHWGLEMASYGGHRPWLRYGYSVVPSLVASASLLLPDAYEPLALSLQLAGFQGLYWFDRRVTQMKLTPEWYPKLRMPLTTMVSGCLVLGILSHWRATLQNK